MGKFMRKPKLTRDKVAIIDVVVSSPSSLGVRTRAKTLALQKLQDSSNSTIQTPPELRREVGYLQLRSRRLEKQNPDRGFLNGSGFIVTRVEKAEQETEECCYFGENNVEFDAREERSTRESTPCSLIGTPSSSSKRCRNLEASNQVTQNTITRSMPLAQEIEEFFARHEQEQQRQFADKYNFDIVNENPLEGCYEWVRVESL
uniref:cyclin-dependent kinase inhibitor 3-like n=1 Tax=Erigeron canadensis TaxID=72917 RepID=UPI001CB986BC|nr:cyclin-dependent kinase inhibitor 3-like [Erigeron canadensis]